MPVSKCCVMRAKTGVAAFSLKRMSRYLHLLGLQGMVGTKPTSGKRMVVSLTRSRA